MATAASTANRCSLNSREFVSNLMGAVHRAYHDTHCRKCSREVQTMRISTPLVDIKDQLISFISEGFGIIGYAFENRLDQGIVDMQQDWIARVTEYFDSTFPRKKESGQFVCTPVNDGLFYNNMHAAVKTVVNGVNTKVQILENILGNLERYYQFEPETLSVDIQHIDSFEKVRGVNHRDIEPYVNNGFFNRDEGTIKRAFAEIIGESFVPKDWGGETED